MKDITVWILTLFLLVAGVVLFYYGLYFFFGTIGVIAFVAVAITWVIYLKLKK
jgi:hypothetical protein